MRAESRSMRWPLTVTAPRLAGSSPPTSFSRVDLPAPEGPETKTNSPGLMQKLTSASIFRPRPKDLKTCWNSIMGTWRVDPGPGRRAAARLDRHDGSRDIPHVSCMRWQATIEGRRTKSTRLYSVLFNATCSNRERMTMKFMKLAAVSAALLFAGTTAQAGETYNAVKARGFVQCGVNAGLPGFSQADSKGVWKGIDIDMCRAVAAMVFGDASKFKATPLTTQQRFTAL